MTQRDPYNDPYCRPEDLGLAIPESNHAISVCLPTWADVIGYEEGDERVIDALECGYPRFVEHPLVAELFSAAQEEFARDGELALVFPSLAAAWRCAEFARSHGAKATRLESYGWGQLTVLLVREEDYPIAWKGWQHAGEIVSSRLAISALSDAPVPRELEKEGDDAREIVRGRVAACYAGAAPEDVFLFASGMAALSAIHRVVTRLRPDLPTIQLEFPYLDLLKVQEKFNPAGAVRIEREPDGGLAEVTRILESGPGAAALFTEVPSNPLLRTGDLKGIAEVLQRHGAPLIIDDTIATSVNIDAMIVADVVTTSLTKGFSGACDVAGGSVTVNPGSPFAGQIRSALAEEEAAAPLFCGDALTLEVNSRHYGERLLAMNENAAVVVAFLREHPRVESLWYPDGETRTFYDQVRRAEGGYGALISMKVGCGEVASASFFDRLRISKGPSLGTNFSLACPYSLLAHYEELEWAERSGVPRDLIRIWIGLEDPEDLVERFAEALG